MNVGDKNIATQFCPLLHFYTFRSWWNMELLSISFKKSLSSQISWTQYLCISLAFIISTIASILIPYCSLFKLWTFWNMKEVWFFKGKDFLLLLNCFLITKIHIIIIIFYKRIQEVTGIIFYKIETILYRDLLHLHHNTFIFYLYYSVSNVLFL